MRGLERRGDLAFYVRATADHEARQIVRALEVVRALQVEIDRLTLTAERRGALQRSVAHVVGGLTRNVPNERNR